MPSLDNSRRETRYRPHPAEGTGCGSVPAIHRRRSRRGTAAVPRPAAPVRCIPSCGSRTAPSTGPAGPIAIRIYWPPSDSDGHRQHRRARRAVFPRRRLRHRRPRHPRRHGPSARGRRRRDRGVGRLPAGARTPLPRRRRRRLGRNAMGRRERRRARRRPEPDGRGRGFGRRQPSPRWSRSGPATTAAPPIAFQLLWYPSTMWDASLPSFTENAAAPILDAQAVAAFSRWYAGEVDLSDPPSGMAPGRAKDLSRSAAGLHRRRRPRSAARRRHPVRRAAGRRRRRRRGAQRRDAGARLPRLRRRGARRHRRRSSVGWPRCGRRCR